MGRREIIGALVFTSLAGGVAALIGVTAVAPDSYWHLPLIVIGWAIIAASLMGVAWLLLTAKPKRPAAELEGLRMSGDNYTNNGNNFGHIGPVTIGAAKFELTQADVLGVLKATPKDSKILVQAIGGPKADRMGDVIVAAFDANGFNVVQYAHFNELRPRPEEPLTVHPGPITTVTIYPYA